MYTKKNIVILANGSLPIPSILGGAVENLVTTILFKNEISSDFNFTVISPIYNIEQQLKYKFKHCQFILINTSTITFTIAKIFRYFANRIPGINIESQFLYTAKKRLKVINDIDIIIIENAPNYLNFFDKKKFPNLVLHLHNDYISNCKNFNNKIFSKAILIITVSKYLEQKLRQNSSVNLNIKTLYNGIDLERFNIDILSLNEVVKIKSKLNLFENDFIIAFAGRLQEDKGVELVIDAFMNFKYFDKSKLLIIGSSKFANSLSDNFMKKILKKAQKFQDRIIFTNYIDYSKIHLYYSIPNIFVLPSLCEEAFGMTILEAIASSKPVIVTDAGGIPEVVDKSCAIIIKRDKFILENMINHLNIFFENPSLIKQFGINSHVRSMSFSDEIYHEKFVEYITSL
jgi:spore coat protein SA